MNSLEPFVFPIGDMSVISVYDKIKDVFKLVLLPLKLCSDLDKIRVLLISITMPCAW